MTELHVRNIPPELRERLSARAAAEGRSLSAEVVAILRAALDPPVETRGRRDAIERLLRIQARARLTEGAPTAEELVREDRDASA